MFLGVHRTYMGSIQFFHMFPRCLRDSWDGRLAMARQGYGKGSERLGMACHGQAWLRMGRYAKEWLGQARYGLVRPDLPWLGMAKVRLGMDR